MQEEGVGGVDGGLQLGGFGPFMMIEQLRQCLAGGCWFASRILISGRQ